MAEILGKFTSNEFTVLKPKQQQPEGGKGKPKPSDTPPPPSDSPEEKNDDGLEEMPLKTKEEILEDLKNAGVNEQDKNEEKTEPEPYDIGDKSKGKKEGDESEKEGKGEVEDGKEKQEKPTEGKTETQKKIDEKNAKLKEQRDLIKTKNIITEKINHYNTVLVKHGDNLPPKVKVTLNNAISELETLRSSIKTT